ncbi:MAG: class I SAM-dependent methyltransferase [Gorillibacterium sp.]|nr:class I SAM-dependent methyltransferase [Gorillibacterium sp.]
MLSIVYTSWRNEISPMPSSAPVKHVVSREIELLTVPKGGGLIVEAGSGWGTLALHAASRHRGWRIVGIENSPLPLWISRLRARLTHHTEVAFVRGDLYTYPFEDTNVVLCYLYPGAMKRLSPIFQEKLGVGTRVISVCFALPGWKPERIITCKDLYQTKVYVYVWDSSIVFAQKQQA